MNLKQKQALEKDAVQRLANSINTSVTDVPSLIDTIKKADDFNIDVARHLKAAINCYLSDKEQEK